MIAQGWRPAEIGQLPARDLADLHSMFASGAIGPYADAVRTYRLLNAIHELRRTVMSLASKSRPPPAADFEEMFPEMAALLPSRERPSLTDQVNAWKEKVGLRS